MNRNCRKSRRDKCPLADDCYGLVDDGDDCRCRLEDYNKGREDAFKEIAYSENIIKEPFEVLAYKRGRTEAIDEFAERLSNWCADECFLKSIDGVKAELLTLDGITDMIFELAEKLKEKENDV